jgi:hypothetical protein
LKSITDEQMLNGTVQKKAPISRRGIKILMEFCVSTMAQ